MDNDYKLVVTDFNNKQFELYNLKDDPGESLNIAKTKPGLFEQMISTYQQWHASVDASIGGQDYPGGTVSKTEPESRFWTDDERYRPYFEAWEKRPEYADWVKRSLKKKTRN